MIIEKDFLFRMKIGIHKNKLTIAAIIIGGFLVTIPVDTKAQETPLIKAPLPPPLPQKFYPVTPSSPGPPPYTPISPAPPPQPAPSGPPGPSTITIEKGVVNPRTGEFFPGTFGGVINPKTGVFLPKVEGGYQNPETGQVIPSK